MPVEDVDCVLATTEIEKLLSDNLGDDELETVAAAFEHEDNSSDFIYSHRGGGSGGYLDFVYQSASESLFGQKQPEELRFTKVRNNKDFLETTLEIDGEVKLRFAKAYGFRSIQNLVTRLKTKRGNAYDYIEVMACPSGCLNGGAQIRYDDREMNESILTRMTDDYNALESYRPLTCEKFDSLFTQLKRDIDKQSLYTRFRAIQKEESNALTIKW